MSNINVKDLLSDITSNISQIEKLGITCSQRNGKPTDPKQKQAIDLATKIGVLLIQKEFFKEAFNIAKPLCNMTMGPRKAVAATTIAKNFILKNQTSFAQQMALLLAPLKGKLKLLTVFKITQSLINAHFIEDTKPIITTLAENPLSYAQETRKKLEHLLAVHNSTLAKFSTIKHIKDSKFAKAHHLNMEALKRSSNPYQPVEVNNDNFSEQLVDDDSVELEYNFSDLKLLCHNFIKQADPENSSVLINSANKQLDYTYSTIIDKEKIRFSKKSSYENKELILNFETNQLFINNTLDNKSRNLFINYFNQIISDLESDKATIKGSNDI